jgi:hypothetical protein
MNASPCSDWSSAGIIEEEKVRPFLSFHPL